MYLKLWLLITAHALSEEFETFLLKNGIKHITSAPYHSSTNSLAEYAVQIVKQGLKKEKEESMKTRLAKVMLAYRVSPQSTTGESPALLLQKRQIVQIGSAQARSE